MLILSTQRDLGSGPPGMALHNATTRYFGANGNPMGESGWLALH